MGGLVSMGLLMVMGVKMLREYIRLMVEDRGGIARVPTQLLPPEETETDKDEVDEFSAVGAGSVAGYAAPLGSKSKRK